jgi:hypothetical protein
MIHQFTIPDIMEEKDMICDVKYKDYAIPIGLISELDGSNNILYNEEVLDKVEYDLFDKLLINERRRKNRKRTKKNKAIRIAVTLKNRL